MDDPKRACEVGSGLSPANSAENADASPSTDALAEPPVELSTRDRNGTLEKMIAKSGTVAMKIDLRQLDPGSIARKTALYFAAEENAFFTVLVFNDEFRGLQPGSMGLVLQKPAALAGPLSSLSQHLVLESRPWEPPYEMVVRDSTTGFIYFEIEGQENSYDARAHSLSIRGGRLLLSKEFAAEMGRSAGIIAGEINVNTTLRPIEISQVVDGEVSSDVLPAAGHENGTTPGPDVIVGDVNGLAQFGGSAAGQVGLAVGTDSCNAGTEDLNWFALPNNDHPVIPQNVYRMSGGASNNDRFEQIGQSSVKHAFQALTGNLCNFGCNGVGGTHLGSGCSDPYGASLNAGQGLGSRAWIDPFTGAFPGSNPSPNDHSGHIHQGPSHRLLTNISDLNTDLNPGSSYYAEAQYVTPHEYAWCQSHPGECNMYNNVSYRQYSVTGTNSPFSFAAVSQTVRTQPAINAWTGATRIPIQSDPGNDGVGVVGYKVSNPSPGVWHYEYAIYNQNLDRAVGSFTVPLGNGAVLSDIGFHAPPQHPGWANDGTVGDTGYSSTPWAQDQAGDSITWSTETFVQNPNANAIRWGTMYNFRFDSNHAPAEANATVGFYKTGAPITVAVQAPGAIAGTPIPTPSGTPSPTPAVSPSPTPTPAATPCGTYTFSVTTGQEIVPGTAFVAGTNCDDCVVPIALPFPFRYYGVPFSSANIDSNGTLQFDTSESNFVNGCLPYINYSFTVLPHWDDMIANVAGNGTYTSVSGTAPNRIFNIEWRTGYYGNAQGSANFEIRLYETTGQIDFVYGIVTDFGNSATIGLERDSSVFSQFSCNTPSLSPGMKVSWTATGCPTPSPTPTPTPTPTPIPTPTPTPSPTPVRTAFDFDFDGRADVSVFRPAEGNWYIQRSTAGFSATNWGLSTDKITPADYDGDGKTDIAVYRPSEGNWYILRSSTGTALATHFGVAEDTPVPADYDTDGLADLAVFRPSSGTWWINRSNRGLISSVFGQSTDIPVAGDYEGLGRSEVAVFRPSNGTWYYSSDFADPSHHFTAVQFGASTDRAVPADIDGDRKTDIAVFRPSNGVWYWLNSSNSSFNAVQFGISEDIPVAADYDGDGRADIAVFRPSSGVWYRFNSSNGTFVAVQFGANGDRPIPAAFRP